MPIFKFEIVETLNKIVNVRAEDEAAAKEMLIDSYGSEEIVLDYDDKNADTEFWIISLEDKREPTFTINC
jgi:hypothetical protein